MQEKFHTNISGQIIAYRDSRAISKSAIVFVHGIGASSRYMVPLADELSRSFRVVSVDFPGFGGSRNVPVLKELSDYSDFLTEFICQLQLESVVLVGNSFGCEIIVDLMTHKKAAVNSAVLLGPTIDSKARTLNAQLKRYLIDVLKEPKLSRGLWLLLKDYVQARPAAVARTLQVSLKDPVEDKIIQIKQPLLIIRGSKDPIAPDRWTKEIAQRAPQAVLRTVPGAHVINATSPKIVASHIKEFLGSK